MFLPPLLPLLHLVSLTCLRVPGCCGTVRAKASPAVFHSVLQNRVLALCFIFFFVLVLGSFFLES